MMGADEEAISEKRRRRPPLAVMRSGIAVIGDTQFLPGYSLLLREPRVGSLEDLSFSEREVFLKEMALLGEAVKIACSPRRVNYSIYGNTDAFLHAHVFPRFDWEPVERVMRPVWTYPEVNWTNPLMEYDEQKHGALREQISAALKRLMRLA
jgi:diadenosine tetraphosphate (Ap4A) HIT family hydrolase